MPTPSLSYGLISALLMSEGRSSKPWRAVTSTDPGTRLLAKSASKTPEEILA